MQIFIDKFFIPQNAIDAFTERLNINRNFIKTLDGFIRDSTYQSTDEAGNMTCITVAVWENEEVLKKAKEAVHNEYQKQDFNPVQFMEELNVKMERGVFTEMR